MTETPTTRTVTGTDLDGTMTLVGEAGGHSAIYESKGSSLMMGCLVVETEHGPLYLDPEGEYQVVNDSPAVAAVPEVALTASDDLDVQGLTDEPATCPQCGVRTDFDEHPDGSQTHICPNPNCRYMFKGVFDPDDFDDDGNFIAGDEDDEAATPRPTTVMATYQPQAWANNYAIDIDGKFTFDVTDQILAMGRTAALDLEDSTDRTDMLYFTAVHNGLVPDREGPFDLTVAQAIHEFYGQNTDKFYGMGD